jgi:SNF2 family DNA or RNA helicase
MKHAYLLYTGYGKTKLCLDKIIAAPKKPRTLLLSTKNIIESSWIGEINKWYPGQISYGYITGKIKEQDRMAIVEQQYDILGMNTEMLDWYISHTTNVKRKSYTKNGIKLHYDEQDLIDRFDLLIIDEVSLFKNSRSQRFKLIKKWAHQIKNVMVLSATPTPKDIEDIWAPIYLLDGGQRLGKNITEFRNNYAIPVPLMNGQNRYQYSIEATNHILNLIKDVSTSIPEPPTALFPEPIIKKLIIKPDQATADMLAQFKNDFIVQLNDGNNLIAFSKTQLINKVNQIASGNVYNQNQVVSINNLKLRVLEQRIASINTPVLITYTYVFDKEQLLKLPGARLLSNQQDFEDWNANKIKVGILSPFSAAHGLNLQHSDCQDIFWFSPIWDTEKWIQTNARICRRGQTRQVTINVLLMKESYDEYAFEICQDKFKAQYSNLLKLR